MTQFHCQKCKIAKIAKIEKARAVPSLPKPPERLQRREPVAGADLLAFLAAARRIPDRDLDDPLSAGQDARRDFVIQLEAGRLQIQRRDVGPVKQFVCRDGVRQKAACRQPPCYAQAPAPT